MQNTFKISESDCKDILANYFKKKKNFEINSFSVEPISDSVGFMGIHKHLKIAISDQDTSTITELLFFVKTLKEDNQIMVEFVKTGNVFNKEISCYKFLDKLSNEYPNIDVSPAPKYYFSRENEVIVLENLYDSGYKVYDSVYLDMNHIKVALTALAKFHAGSFAFEEIRSKNLGREYRVIEDYGEYLQEALFKNDKDYIGYKYIETGLKALQALIDEVPSPVPHDHFKNKISEIAVYSYEILEPSRTYRNVWSHGDLWINNVMFQYEGGVPNNCKIFDFQLQRYVLPAYDVLLMIYDSVSKDIYQNELDNLLNHYLECLENELKRMDFNPDDIILPEEFYSEVVLLFPTVKLIKAIHKAIIGAGVGYDVICIGDPSKKVIETFKTDQEYRNLMTWFLKDLEEVVRYMD